jgi:MFS transporter, PAT family, beta-lactamase induction signal transducer AmpG
MRKFLSLFTDRKMAIVFTMGFASGLPLLLTASTLQAWLVESKVSLAGIGLFSLTQVPYSLKFLWSPLLDRFIPPFLGRRRGWMAVTQIGLVLALIALSFCQPSIGLSGVTVCALAVAYLSATQDIALDAYRRELLPIQTFGFGNSLAITGYRLGMMLAGAGALALADRVSWQQTYQIMAAVMSLGLIVTLLSPEPEVQFQPPRSFSEAFVDPFVDFLKKDSALWILAFLLLYKIGDNMATSLTTPFYMSLGYTKTTIGATSKIFGIWATIIGGMIGGIAMTYIGLRRSLWVFGIIQGLANLGFFWLTLAVTPGMDESLKTAALALAISLENVTAGMGTAAFTAFMANLTNKKFTATQYALFSSLMSVPRTIIPSGMGFLSEAVGWPKFFVICTTAAIPGLLILLKIGRHADEITE